MREKDGTRYLRDYSQWSALFSPSIPAFLSAFSTRPQVPCETVGAILYTANRVVFLVPVPISSHRRTKRKGVLKEMGFRVRLCVCKREKNTEK